MISHHESSLWTHRPSRCCCSGFLQMANRKKRFQVHNTGDLLAKSGLTERKSSDAKWVEVRSQDPTGHTQDICPASYAIPCILPQNLPAAFGNFKGHTICSFLLIMKTVCREFKKKEKKRKLVWEMYLSNLSVFIAVTMRMTYSLRLMAPER